MSYCDWDKTSDANRRYHDEEWGYQFLMTTVINLNIYRWK